MILKPEQMPVLAIKMNRRDAQILKKKIENIDVKLDSEERAENMRLLEECRMWWDSLRNFRQRRRRNERYHRGDQWGDIIEDPENKNKFIREDEYIKAQGKVPLKQNVIRQMMKNLVGQYRKTSAKPLVSARGKDGTKGAEMLTNAISYVYDFNFLEQLDARTFEEFALSGLCIHKQGYKYIPSRDENDIKVKVINPNRIFFNTDIEDIRGDDIRIIGEIIDTPLDEIINTFAKTPADEERIREKYKYLSKDTFFEYTGLSAQKMNNLDFYLTEDTSKARMYEVWFLKHEWRTMVHDWADGSWEVNDLTLDEIEMLNQQRIEFAVKNGVNPEEVPLIEGEPIRERIWYVKYLTPYGETLWEGRSPYLHQEHPYSILAYPLIDGEVWGFVEDIIDQQRYINRMIILLDFIMSASAKGVLMVPQDVIPDGMTPEDFAEEWRSFNGVIIYKPSKYGQIPKQITSNSTAVGLADMLQYQMKFLNDISGIHGAIQGKEAKAGTPSALYAQEAENASTNTKDLFDSFYFFRQRRDEKIMKLILQYYNEKKYIAIEGNKEPVLYDPDVVRMNGKMYDLKITHTNDTPVYRQMINETLMRLVEMQMIDVKTFLENTTLPYASSILESLKKRETEMQQQQAAMAGNMQQIPGANPEAQQMLQQAIAG